jgi:hypothetical protein
MANSEILSQKLNPKRLFQNAMRAAFGCLISSSHPLTREKLYDAIGKTAILPHLMHSPRTRCHASHRRPVPQMTADKRLIARYGKVNPRTDSAQFSVSAQFRTPLFGRAFFAQLFLLTIAYKC